MTATESLSIYLGVDGKLSIRPIKEKYIPRDAQSLVRVLYSGINPADIRHAFMGMAGSTAGYEFAGTVEEAGPTSPFKKGQKVFGIAIAGNNRPSSLGAHQDFLIAEPQWTWSLPKGIDELTAATFPIAALTSMDALFNQLNFAFPPASVPGDDPIGVPILIWGGGSALGQAAIQLAKAAGFSPIITTASPRNHNLLKRVGATHCFDYNSGVIEDDIRGAVADSGKHLTTVYDAVGAGLGFAEGLPKEDMIAVRARFNSSSPAKARRCCATDKTLKLCCALPVDQEPDWLLPLPYRLAVNQEEPPLGSFEPVRALIMEADRTWGDRLNTLREWSLSGGGKNWSPIAVKTVQGADAAVDAINDVFAGRGGGRKFVVEHPLSR